MVASKPLSGLLSGLYKWSKPLEAFLLASAGSGRAELEALLAKPELVESIVGPVRADCLVYAPWPLKTA